MAIDYNNQIIQPFRRDGSKPLAYQEERILNDLEKGDLKLDEELNWIVNPHYFNVMVYRYEVTPIETL